MLTQKPHLKLVRAQHFANEQIISAVVAKFYRAACQLSISGMQEEAVSSSVAPIADSPDIAFELGVVARITCAPPNSCNASAAFVDWLSMYTLAPSFLASTPRGSV
jgi:hypothetical protein